MSFDGILMASMTEKKMADLSQTVFIWFTNEAFKRTRTHSHIHTNTHGYTLMNAIGENAMHCISLKNQGLG